MEEEKAAAYYDELTRKGEGAARFKQGLGFSSGAAAVPERGSAVASSSSLLSQFVRASSNPNSSGKHEKDSEIRSIRDKLKRKKPEDQQHPRVPERNYRESSERRRHRSRERDERDKCYRRRSRRRSAESRNRYGDKERRRSSSRSSSPRRERRRSEDERRGSRREEVKEERDRKKIDYSRLIKGYDEMSAAEKVKAKMKFQLDETSEKDTSKGAGWERFEFDKDAPVDDERVEEGTDDDGALVKRMGQSFRFSAVEARREEQLIAAHDEAMFGALTRQNTDDDVAETTNSAKDNEGESNSGAINILSEKVLAKQQGSWRDRARKT